MRLHDNCWAIVDGRRLLASGFESEAIALSFTSLVENAVFIPRSDIITDGRSTLGIIIVRDEFEAITPHGGSLGFYATEAATARELWRHNRPGWTTIGEESARVMQRLSASRTEAA